MTYYDPLYPNIEATRYEILRGLESLEEKLKLVCNISYFREEI